MMVVVGWMILVLLQEFCCTAEMVDTVIVTAVYSDIQEGVGVGSVASCIFFFGSVVGPSIHVFSHKLKDLLQPALPEH